MQRMHESATTVKAPTTPKKKENTQKNFHELVRLESFNFMENDKVKPRHPSPPGGRVQNNLFSVLRQVATFVSLKLGARFPKPAPSGIWSIDLCRLVLVHLLMPSKCGSALFLCLSP